ncbi:uncharacterized protein MYCFIDRAFT_64251 [Pseudocercospora fijiensis CIRAD86]|uniref:NmrA-like domain-containing protein n=1 Tax=Pseudocercospora fijiensis (strain CIRAD86) TaxID=383855 RepID=M2ZVG8_PSEFD|nr:uncharacterized protein MYCFIDRAFT_64251 [Pseudocercospora fijiensis CIRAD86]EME82999.1 hypothetical protein MYCFIDRAFT_64251 [Pseudocercospora fijiensis CIRAD86]
MTTSILVLGLGELGEEVVKAIALHRRRDSTQVSVLLRSRKPDQISRLEQWNVSLVKGDVDQSSQDELAAIFKDFGTVICCIGMYSPPSMQIKIAKAVLDAEVKRYFPWQFGIDYDIIGRGKAQDLFDSQVDVRDILRSQYSTKWVIVSTGLFIPFFFEPAFGIVNAERTVVTAIGGWENKLTATNPEDIGKCVAELALVDTDAQGVVYVSGDTISIAKLADVVEDVMGKKVERVLKTVPDLKKELSDSPDDAMTKYRVVFGEGTGTSWSREDSYNAKKGMETQSVADWAKKNLQLVQ